MVTIPKKSNPIKMDSVSDSDYLFTDLTFNETRVNSSYGFSLNANNSKSENDNGLSLNYSEYIVPPEKDGSPFVACASILFKSDLKVKKHFHFKLTESPSIMSMCGNFRSFLKYCTVMV